MTDQKNAILCVDDEENILNSLKRLLRKEEYTLFTASGAREGLEIMKKENIQVVLSDQKMPETTGIEFLQEVKRLYPTTVRVVLSGFADLSTIVEAINQGEIFRFLTKPWIDDNLKADIRQCFRHYEIVQENHQLFELIKEKNEKLEEMNAYLERQVDERTQFLQMSQDILEQLPQPVIGISADKQIIMVNTAAAEKFTELSLFFPGTPMDELIPESVCKMIEVTLNSAKNYSGSVAWNGTDCNIVIQPLVSENCARGLILTIQ